MSKAQHGYRGDWLKRGDSGVESGKRVTSRFLMDRYEVCDRTIDRWAADPLLNFPKPLVVNGRRYWLLTEIVGWEEAREHAQRETEAAA